MHIHLDAVGGIAGDMFVAAMVDAWPEHQGHLVEVLAQLDLAGVTAQIVDHDDGTLLGRRFVVEMADSDTAEPIAAGAAHVHDDKAVDAHVHDDRAGHIHGDGARGSFRGIRSMLTASSLPGSVRERAIDIFTLLADAEGKVHGSDPDDVVFHEVGSWDSIVDIVAAAALIDLCPGATWSIGPLPVGSGRVDTAHGILPVPAPATVILLRGIPVVHDGVAGERVTPTGAAIARHLEASVSPPSTPMNIDRCGHGFGTRKLPGIPNMLRVISYGMAQSGATDRVGVVRFEVDDQTAEDLAVGLDRLRQRVDVLDVTQSSVVGKKGRLASHIQVLAHPDAVEAVVEACFTETTTIGVRFGVETRMVLRRRIDVVSVNGHDARVKTSTRPGGDTSKAEMDDVAGAGDHAARADRRAEAEAAVSEDAHGG